MALNSFKAQSIFIFASGLVLLLAPEFTLGVLGYSSTYSFWILILAWVMIAVAGFYFFLSEEAYYELKLYTVFSRITFAIGLILMVVTKVIPPIFMALCVLYIAMAYWGYVEIKPTKIPSKKEIEKAEQRITSYIHKTPLVTNLDLNRKLGFDLYLKCENQQKIGAFKARGALNAALQLSPLALKNGLCTHSSGNHAQAVALAAKELGTIAYVVMPNNAPKVKKEGVQHLNGIIHECEPNLQAREEGVKKIQKEQKATFIHPFDNHEVICGQATTAKEILNKSHFDAIIAPVGGGGLLSGTALSAHYFGENTLVFGAEPLGAADAVLSIKTKQVEKAPYLQTIADGLFTNLSNRTLRIILKHVTDIYTVSDEEIIDAMKIVKTHFDMAIEPSGAVSIAAAIRNKKRFKGLKVSAIISGGNVDVEQYDFF